MERFDRLTVQKREQELGVESSSYFKVVRQFFDQFVQRNKV
jgi:hypothetical protein